MSVQRKSPLLYNYDSPNSPFGSLGGEHTRQFLEEIKSMNYSRWSYLFIWFIIIVILTWLFLFSLKPDFVKKEDHYGDKTDEVDTARVLIWSLVISLIVAVIIWLIRHFSIEKHHF